jgi:hypothetical protein
LLLGIAAARQPLPARVCVVPLALFELIVPSYLLRGYGSGNDEIIPGEGDDNVFAGAGNDLIYARDTEGVDYIDCGGGFDKVETIHRDDRTRSNCERALGPRQGEI